MVFACKASDYVCDNAHANPKFVVVFVCLCRQETSTYTSPLENQVIDRPVTVYNYGHTNTFVLFSRLILSLNLLKYVVYTVNIT